MNFYLSTMYMGSPMYNKMENSMDSYVCLLYATQPYVSILSYSPFLVDNFPVSASL